MTDTNTNEYKGYALHLETADNELRTWNQRTTLQNVQKDLNESDVHAYKSLLPKSNIKMMGLLELYINARGEDEVQREVFRNSVANIA